MISVALLIVIANDYGKRRLIEDAEKEGKKPRRAWYANKTDWGMVVGLLVCFAIYSYLLNHPELTDRDFGPFTPWVRFTFPKSAH
jgi:hypothetical protein